MTTTPHIQSGARRRMLGSIVLVSALVATALPASTAAHAGTRGARTVSAARAGAARSYSYGWPVAPFERQHPVRGNFGDPRTTFHGPPTRAGLMTGPGAFSLHQGIDISAPDGTAVYPVVSGTVRIVTPDWIEVDSEAGHAFQYWHVDAAVRPGDHVEARHTVLGRILRGSQHVHLTELRYGRAVNPLAPGHIGPYADRTTPRVTAVTFRSSETGPDVLPEYVHGRVAIIVAAEDTPTLPVPGRWHDLPVSPAKLTYRIQRLGPKPVGLTVPETVAMDMSRHLPASSDLWATYARGSRMNMANFGQHRYWFQPGAYLFKLTPSLFDTRRLADGVYRLTVTAADVAGNRSSYGQVFSVHNRSGWLRG